MAIIQRPPKQGGSVTYQGKVAQGYTKILASEADADHDTMYAAWNGGVDAVNIRPDAVTAEKIAPDAVGTRALADGGVTQPKLATGVSVPPSGAAAGRLVGTYPAPGLAADVEQTVAGDFAAHGVGRITMAPRARLVNAANVSNWLFNDVEGPGYDPGRAGAGIDLAEDGSINLFNHAPGGAWVARGGLNGVTNRWTVPLADGLVSPAMLTAGAVYWTGGVATNGTDVALANGVWTQICTATLNLSPVPPGETAWVLFWGYVPFYSALTGGSLPPYIYVRIWTTHVVASSGTVSALIGGGGVTVFGEQTLGPGVYNPILLQAFADFRGATGGTVVVQGGLTPRLMWVALR